jgi:alkanesulfonate monooxygenase SsuD/methylene tetrahydromethanopterin reductase-like flavin-dependent oxidoreductase (luciferase family)
VPTLGILHDLRQPVPHTVPAPQYYAECLDEIALADELGFDTVWLSEHHFTHDGFLAAPLAALAAIAVRTRRIRLGTSVLVAPLHHPLRIAEDAALVDLLSGGRLVLGIGQGYAEAEFAAFGADRSRRASRTEETVDIVRQALTTGRVTIDGSHFAYTDLPVTPSPMRPVPIPLAGVTAAGLRRAVRLGDGVVVYCATARDLRARAALLHEVSPTADTPLMCTSVLHVAEDPDQAWEEAAPGIAYLEAGIAALSGAEPVDLVREDYLVGSPDDVAERLIALWRDTGFAHFAYWARLPGLPHRRVLQSLELVADTVATALRSVQG